MNLYTKSSGMMKQVSPVLTPPPPPSGAWTLSNRAHKTSDRAREQQMNLSDRIIRESPEQPPSSSSSSSKPPEGKTTCTLLVCLFFFHTSTDLHWTEALTSGDTGQGFPTSCFFVCYVTRTVHWCLNMNHHTANVCEAISNITMMLIWSYDHWQLSFCDEWTRELFIIIDSF